MDENTAWLNFENTGLVSDYLEYSKIRDRNLNNLPEGTDNANKYRGPYYNGKECGRK